MLSDQKLAARQQNYVSENMGQKTTNLKNFINGQ